MEEQPTYWLVKTEPDEFSWDDLVAKGTAMWDGVRNFRARSNLKKMKIGDSVLVYHTGKEKAIVGLATVAREAYPDPTATDGAWVAVDLKAVEPLQRMTLKEVKAMPELAGSALARLPRLSVMYLTPEEFSIMCRKL